MRRLRLATIALPFWILASSASAADFEEYARLVELSNAAHAALEEASPELLPALRENAYQRDIAVIQWLDEFLNSDEFTQLPQSQQDLAYRDRYRNEYNASRLLIQLDRCDEASSRIRTLLDSPIFDAELRPRLTEAYEEALTCANRPRTASLTVQVSPEDAELLLDGEVLGLATASHEVSLGEHALTLRADGYEPQELSFQAQAAGEEVRLGPIVLTEIEEREQVPPTWYEWTLWGAGVAGIAAGVGYYVMARNREDEIENPPSGQEVVDADKELETVDRLDTAAYILGGVGIAAAIAGTVSYFVRRSRSDDEDRTVTWGPGMLADGPAFFLRVDL